MASPMRNPTAGEKKSKLKLLIATVETLLEDELCQGRWPTPADPEDPADILSSYSCSSAHFNADVKLDYDDEADYLELVNSNGPDNDYYNGDVYITREEYEEFFKAWPEFKVKRAEAAKVNVGKIADLNRQVALLIDEMTELAEEAGVDLYIDLGQHGCLDPSSDWQSYPVLV